MAITYDILDETLKRKGYKRSDLLEVISSKTLAKLKKNEVITSDTIDKICIYLDCQPNDIMTIHKNRERSTEELAKMYNFEKYVIMPNEDGTYTRVQRKLFKAFVEEKVISKEKIEEMKKDNLFKKSYEYKKL